MGSITDLVFSQTKVPLASWVTLGRQIDMKAASFRSKASRIKQSMADFLGQVFFPEKNGEPISEKSPPSDAPCSQLLPRCARQLADLRGAAGAALGR